MIETFSQRVVKAALSVPKGKVTTYGDLAWVSGGSGQAARSVNGILVRAFRKGETTIPFHRIVFANGRVWKSQDHYALSREALYEEEGIEIDERGFVKDFRARRYKF